MSRPTVSHRRLSLRGCALGLAFLCSAATAASASAAGLKIDVPTTLRKGQLYTITISGSYKPTQVKSKSKAYLIAAIQYSSQPCKATAQLENAVSSVQFYFLTKSGAGIFEPHSPFTRVDGFTAKSIGSRQVCAYLYSKKIGVDDRVAPLAKATRGYKVTKK